MGINKYLPLNHLLQFFFINNNKVYKLISLVISYRIHKFIKFDFKIYFNKNIELYYTMKLSS